MQVRNLRKGAASGEDSRNDGVKRNVLEAFRALMIRLDAVYADRAADAPEDFKPRIDFWQRECGMGANLCAELHELRKWSNAVRHLDDERWAREGPQSEEQAAER